MEQIVIGPVSHPLPVAEDLLDEGVVEESLKVIAAFLVIRVGCKKCGNFYSMIFQTFAGAQQLVLFLILAEKFNIPLEVAVPSA